VSLLEDFRVVIPPKRVGDEQTAEEQDFGDQKDPDPQFAGVKLLLGVVKVVRNKLTVIMVM